MSLRHNVYFEALEHKANLSQLRYHRDSVEDRSYRSSGKHIVTNWVTVLLFFNFVYSWIILKLLLSVFMHNVALIGIGVLNATTTKEEERWELWHYSWLLWFLISFLVRNNYLLTCNLLHGITWFRCFGWFWQVEFSPPLGTEQMCM